MGLELQVFFQFIVSVDFDKFLVHNHFPYVVHLRGVSWWSGEEETYLVLLFPDEEELDNDEEQTVKNEQGDVEYLPFQVGVDEDLILVLHEDNQVY